MPELGILRDFAGLQRSKSKRPFGAACPEWCSTPLKKLFENYCVLQRSTSHPEGVKTVNQSRSRDAKQACGGGKIAFGVCECGI